MTSADCCAANNKSQDGDLIHKNPVLQAQSCLVPFLELVIDLHQADSFVRLCNFLFLRVQAILSPNRLLYSSNKN